MPEPPRNKKISSTVPGGGKICAFFPMSESGLLPPALSAEPAGRRRKKRAPIDRARAGAQPPESSFPRPALEAEHVGHVNPKGVRYKLYRKKSGKKIPPRVNGKFLLLRFSFSPKNARSARQSVYARTPTQKRTPTDRRRASTQPQESSFPRQPDTQRLRK